MDSPKVPWLSKCCGMNMILRLRLWTHGRSSVSWLELGTETQSREKKQLFSVLRCKRRCGESHLKCGVVFPCFYKSRTAVPFLFSLTLISILVSSFFPLEAAQLKIFAYNVQMVPLLRQTHVSCHFPQEPLPLHIKGLVVGVVLHLHMKAFLMYSGNQKFSLLFSHAPGSFLTLSSVTVVLCTAQNWLLHQQVLPY